MKTNQASRIQPIADQTGVVRSPNVRARTGGSSQRASRRADAISARSCAYVPAIVTPGAGSPPLPTSAPASSATSAITPTATTAVSRVMSMPAKGAHSGQRGRPPPAGRSGRCTPSGSSGRDGGDPGRWKEGGGTLVMRGSEQCSGPAGGQGGRTAGGRARPPGPRPRGRGGGPPRAGGRGGPRPPARDRGRTL